MTVALICPRDNVVGILSEDGMSTVLHGQSGSLARTVSTGLAVGRYPNFSLAQVESDDDAFSRLEVANACTRSLDFTLMLFDSNLSEKTRKLAAAALDDLFAVEIYRNYVLDIVLAAPLDSFADSEQAIEVAAEFPQVGQLIRSIVQSQDRVRLAFNASLKLRHHSMVKSESREKILGALIQFGVFRRLVLEAETKVDAEAIFGELALLSGFSDVCDTRILRSFVNDYKSELAVGAKRRRQPSAAVDFEQNRTDKNVSHVDAKQRRRHVGSDDLAEWAAGQVTTIADLFRQGQDVNANNFLEQLVASQTEDTADYRHVVKSLCNLSTKCGIFGREELCMRLLQRAFEYESGLDARAYTLLGDEFRRVKDLDKAEDCYAKASEIESNPEKVDEILRKHIRVSIDRGNYDSAMESYNAITNIHDQPAFLTDKGTLHRRMGDTRNARDCFRTAISLQENRYQAYAGLAEIYKQRGQLHRSLGAYNDILRRFDSSLDPGSQKIYELSQAFLYQITNQFDRAKSVLLGLHHHYGLDRQVNFQLGKLLILMGDPNAAKPYIKESQRPDSIDLGDRLFWLAMADDLGFIAPRPMNDPSTYLPEYRGLATCGVAFDAILRESFEEAWELTRSANYTNQLHHDFGLVLGYHARKRMDRTLSYKHEQPLARIAKRGFPDLRLTVHAVEEGEFDSAIQSERRMLQLVA